ncbi:podocalyxin [Hyla sarda]|uniref:podocalyxin n=1 Tax=Hyla sarda TaxID=327740 RepID=UPI0024C22E4D|nr:podocalyxin [Hyla sarda]
MTRVGYLLPFLWALVCGTTVTTTIPPPTTAIMTTTSASSVTTQAASAVPTVEHTVGQPSPTMPTSAATTPATTKPPTTQSPSVTAVTNKLLTTESKASQTDIQPTIVRTETKSVAATSSGPSLGPLNGNIPNVTSSSDNTPQPTDLPKASTSVLKSSTVVVIPPDITENVEQFTTQLTATSPTYSRTSEPSTGKNVTIDSGTVASTSTVSPSPVTTAKAAIIDSTTSLPKETIPMTTALVNPIQKNLEKIEINCTTEIGGSLVKININPSSICGEYDSKNEDEAKEILKHICSAIKPGYKPDQEKCHIDLGRGPNELVIVNAYVQSSLSTEDLYASLKHIKKDGSFLFNYGAKYEEEDLVSIPLISVIVSMAVALLITAAIYGCCHQRQARKREQRLTEELQTMENGYHDNPTLEVMETSPEMQEKKGGPNGELGDSWIVPLDNLTREDFDEEEDTHL